MRLKKLIPSPLRKLESIVFLFETEKERVVQGSLESETNHAII